MSLTLRKPILFCTPGTSARMRTHLSTEGVDKEVDSPRDDGVVVHGHVARNDADAEADACNTGIGNLNLLRCWSYERVLTAYIIQNTLFVRLFAGRRYRCRALQLESVQCIVLFIIFNILRSFEPWCRNGNWQGGECLQATQTLVQLWSPCTVYLSISFGIN